MNIIFLDVDGVLNNNATYNKSPQKFIGVEDQFLHRLNTIVCHSDAKIILVSDWKECWAKKNEECRSADGVYLNRRFDEHELEIEDRTIDHSRGYDGHSGRGHGIKKYLEDHDDIEQYVIIDDGLFSDYDQELRRHLVLTHNGLTDSDVEVAINILMGKLLDGNCSLMEKNI